MLPFIKIPFLEALPIPAKKLSGIEITNAQGQDITRNVKALFTQTIKDVFNINGGITAIIKANITTTGVYILANFVINFSACAFFAEAFSTKFKIFETVDSSNNLVTFIFRTPSQFIHPLEIASPAFTLFGIDSPVNADVSIEACPSVIMPSRGTFSPVLTVIMSPIFTLSGLTFLPSRFA